MANFAINLIVTIAVILAIISMVIGKADANAEWTKETQSKLDTLTQIGFEPLFAKSLITECKSSAKDPVRCIKIGASIAGAESSMAHRCYKNNCMGIGGGSITYSSKHEGVKDWVKRYNKWWYKQTSPNGFYPLKGQKSPTRYCTDEHSSGTKVGCPFGNRHAWKVFNSLKF